MAGGRPTEYPGDVAAPLVEKYVTNCKEQFYPPHHCEGLAVEFGARHKTLCRLGQRASEFLHTLDVLLSLQGQMLIQNGLKGEYNSTITTQTLSANHD